MQGSSFRFKAFLLLGVLGIQNLIPLVRELSEGVVLIDCLLYTSHDEGKLVGKDLNRALRDDDGDIYDIVAGDFLVVGLGEEDFCSDRKSTRLNSSHSAKSRMPSSA